MTRFLPLLIVASACTEAPLDVEAPAPQAREEIAPLRDTVWVDMEVRSFVGDGVDADLCMADGCYPIKSGYVSLELPRDADVVAWVDDDLLVARTSLQFHTGIADQQLDFVVFTKDELRTLTAPFHVEIDPDLSFIAQQVNHPDGMQPELAGLHADGPFFFDLQGRPLLETRTTPVGGGYYLYVNVEDGPFEMHVLDCIEGNRFWGQPGDGKISGFVSKKEVVGLDRLDCLHR